MNIKDLIGRTITQIHFTYPESLCLDFGELIECHHSKLKGHYHGEWMIDTHATYWEIEGKPQNADQQSDYWKKLEIELQYLVGQKVLDAEMLPNQGFKLKLDKDVFVLNPTDEDLTYGDDVPQWILYHLPNALHVYATGRMEEK